MQPLRYFGEDLVAWRREDGELHVMRGHRAHLWAYIGDGGTVVGECVDSAFLWHQPQSEPPAREMPDIFFSPSSIRDRSPAYRAPYDSAPYDSAPYDSAPYDSAPYDSAPLDNRRERVEKDFRVTMWDDLEIWRNRSTTCLQAPETGANP